MARVKGYTVYLTRSKMCGVKGWSIDVRSPFNAPICHEPCWTSGSRGDAMRDAERLIDKDIQVQSDKRRAAELAFARQAFGAVFVEELDS